MFEGALYRRNLHRNGSSCEKLFRLINSSGSNFDRPFAKFCDSTDIKMSMALLPVSSLALLLTLATLIVFLRAPKRRSTDFRCSLVALTVTLCLYLICATMDFINVLSGACMYWTRVEAHPQVLLAGFVCCLGDSFLSVRNWCNVLLTAQRAEALARPLRAQKLLRRRNFLTCLGISWFIGLALSIIRSLAEAFVVCQGEDEKGDAKFFGHIGVPVDDGTKRSDAQSQWSPFNLLLNYSWFKPFEVYGFFLYQTAVPVALVLAFTIAMVARMMRHHRSRQLQHTSLDDSQQNGRRNRLNASRTVLYMATVFTALHMPAFVGTVLQNTTNFEVASPGGKIFQFCVELCVLLDSVCNLCVYARFVPEFRQTCAGRAAQQGLDNQGGTQRLHLRRMTR